jgi:hypothetical protein
MARRSALKRRLGPPVGDVQECDIDDHDDECDEDDPRYSWPPCPMRSTPRQGRSKSQRVPRLRDWPDEGSADDQLREVLRWIVALGDWLAYYEHYGTAGSADWDAGR